MRSQIASCGHLLAVIALIAFATTVESQIEVSIDHTTELGLDSLTLSCVVLEGRLLEHDWLISDPAYWMNSSIAYSVIADTLYLVSDTSSLGIRTALSLKEALQTFDIREYGITARFPSGVFLPVREFATVDAMLFLKVYPIDALIEGLDFQVPSTTAPLSDMATGQVVYIAGPIPGIPNQVLQRHISGPVPGSLLSPGAIFADRSLIELISLDNPVIEPSFCGAPVFISTGASASMKLIGMCLTSEGVGTSTIGYVRPINPEEFDLSHLIWKEANNSSFLSILPD
jgi:hypothetical protein